MMRTALLSLLALSVSSQVVRATRIQASRLPSGATKVVEAPSGDATTTYYIEASKNSQNPVGALTSIVDTFVGQGTTTEYMTQHIGTHIDNTYAKIQTTSSREYYRIHPTASIGQYDTPVRPTGLIGSSTSLEVHGPASTFYTVEEYRTYVDGHYAHLVSSISNVVTDPAYITPTPIFSPGGLNSELATAEDELKKSLYSSYEFDIKPSRAHKFGGVATRTIGRRPHHELENEIEADLYSVNSGRDGTFTGSSHKVPRQIDLDAVESEAFEVKIEPDRPAAVARPTYTVGENGELNFPTPRIEPVTPEPAVKPTQAHRFGGPAKASKTALDSVTYVGFVDFTTTIDDTVVIFRPKQSHSENTRGLIRPTIVPTRSHSFNPHTQSSAPSRQDSPRNIQQVDTAPHIDSGSLPENERTAIRIEKENQIDDNIKKHTSGIDALKSLLNNRPSRSRGFRPKTEAPKQQASSVAHSTSRNNPFSRVRPSASIRHSGIVSTPLLSEDPTTNPPIDIIASIDPTSDVELVFKTLYTTYTYFTTFFRESTTKVKSREEVISNVITLTNILKSTDLPSISSSCQLDSSCLFKSTDVINPEDFSDGFFGRPNTRLAEEPRSGGEGRPFAGNAIISPSSLDTDVNAVLRTFFTTYTYFTTLFEAGTSTVSTRTEVYSNEQTALVPVSIIDSNSVSILPSSIINTAPTKTSDAVRSAFPRRRLEVSSVRPVNLHSELTTPQSKEDSERPSTDRVPRLNAEGSNSEDDLEEATTTWIQPTPIYSTTLEDGDERLSVTQETPALTEDVTEVITTATTESEENLDVEAVTEFVPRTLYTTFTYFTTLFKEGNSTVTSNLETVTNVMTDAFVEPTTVEPSVTFFTTFTYWTTSVAEDGARTVITSHEETITDILPASVHQNLKGAEATEGPEQTTSGEVVIESTIAPSLGAGADVFTFYSTHYDGDNTIVDTILSTAGPVSTQVPEIQSGEVEVISASPIETPNSAIIQPTSSFNDVDEDFALTTEKEVGVKPTRSRGRISFTRPGNTFTPVIRPLLRDNKKAGGIRFRPTNLRVSTTVATRTRNSVKPTLIATPASSAPQPTPSFGSSSRPGFLASSSLFNRGQSRFSSSAAFSISGSSSIAPSAVASRGAGSSASALPTSEAPSVVISPLGLRRPNPFRARLKEKQLERLANLRKNRPNRVRASSPKSKPEDVPIPIPNLPSLPGGNAPIFVSSQRQFVTPSRRTPKNDDIEVPKEVADRRERARQRIKNLFNRKRPAFGRPKVLVKGDGEGSETQTRRKRQVSSAPWSEFGSRTQARKSYVHNRRSANPRSNPQSYFLDQDNPPFTAFHHNQPSTSTSQTQSLFDYYYEDDDSVDFYDSSNSVRSPVQSSSRHNVGFRRQAPSDVPDPTTRATPLRTRSRSRARLNSRTPSTSSPTSRPRSRTIPSRTRSRFNFRSKATTTTTTAPPRRNFRPRPRSFSSGSSSRFTPTRERDSSRSRFGSSSSSINSFHRGKVIDYSDYDYDYADTEVQSSQNDVPDFITVTHMVPFATQIPIIKFGHTELRDILSTSPSLEVVAVTALKSTDINSSPIIFANAHTLTPRPGVQEIFFDALRATETTSVTFTPTRIRGRKTSFSHAVPTTIYNVETVSTQVVEPVDQNQLLNSLLQQLLIGQNGNQQSPIRPNQPLFGNQANAPSTPVTNFVTHTSTYVTTITEEESTVIPITFRGKAITTTLVESSTKVITATEFSTETQVTQAVVQPTNVLQQITQTQAPRIDVNPLAANPQLASLLPALLGVQQANLFNQQSEAALLQQQLLEQKQQQQLAEQLLAAQLVEQQQLAEQQQHDAFNEELLARLNLDDFSDEDLANLDIEAVVDAVTRQEEKSPLVFPNRNLFGTLPLNPISTPEEKPQPEAPKSSIITIFKSGSSPGDFTKVLSTVFLNERRKRAATEISPSSPQVVVTTEAPALNLVSPPLGGPRGPVQAPIPSLSRLTDELIQSGIVSETETLSSSSVIPTVSLDQASQHP